MKVDLKVTAASKVVTMSHCPKGLECDCGVMYRSV